MEFNGADSGALEATPDFVKSIPAWKAMDENTLIAWEMNGEPLPHWNGAPARIIVPGWTATYWMKQVVSIRAIVKPLTGFWMARPIASRRASSRPSTGSRSRRRPKTRRSPRSS